MKYFIDNYQRQVRYIRVSITDRCNLACMYCKDDTSYIPHEEIISYEEIKTLIRIGMSKGINKVRLTGGEPFARKGFIDFIKDLRASFPSLDLRITTNGTLIKDHIQLIKDLNIKINLSLDCFSQSEFKEITGKDLFDTVNSSLHEMLKLEIPLKVNAVAMKTRNDKYLKEFIALATNYPIDVRFIEFMPMGDETIWEKNLYWSADEILKEAEKIVTLEQVKLDKKHPDSGPATLYSIVGGKGRLGLISPLSSHFCATCNRLRITSDGKLRTCLFDDNEFEIAKFMRQSKSDSEIEEFIKSALQNKAMGYEILNKNKKKVAKKHMVSIGG